MTNAVLYARVSTDEQADKGYSLPSQLEHCREYARHNGLVVVAEFSDDFTGSVPIEMRPEGKKAFTMLKSGEADALICFTMDRLVRPPEDGDEWDTPVLIRSLARLNKQIHLTNRGQLKTDFASLLIAMLDAKSAGDERRKIIERSTRGKMAKAKSGKVVGGWREPYGYRYVNHGFVIDENEAKIVRMIYLAYVEERESVRGIAFRLSQLGVPKPDARFGRDKRPLMWSHSTVGNILRNTVYKGDWYYGKTIGSNGDVGTRPIEDQVRVSVPVIIDADVWDAAQRILKQNSEIAIRNRKRNYILSGMIRCGCGFAMQANFSHGVTIYRCSQRTLRYSKLEERQCFEPQWKADNLEPIVWDYVKGLMLGDFEAELREAQQTEQKRNEPLLRDLEVVNGLLADVEKEATVLSRTVGQVSGLVATKLQHEMEQVNGRYEQLTKKKEEIERQLNSKPLSNEQVDSLMAFRNRVITGIERATPEDIRRYYEILNVKVVIKDHKVQVSCLIESVTSSRADHPARCCAQNDSATRPAAHGYES